MNRYLEMAMGVAMTSKCRQKHGAVVTKHGKVLGVGVNVMKNDPRFVDWKLCHIHAEITALRKAGMPRKATVYVTRVNRSGEPRMSRPCPSCQEVLSGLRCKVIWTENIDYTDRTDACNACGHITAHSGGGIGVCLTEACSCDGQEAVEQATEESRTVALRDAFLRSASRRASEVANDL